MKFNTVLHLLQHPRNVGMITRSHVAFGGDKLIFLGYKDPWVYSDEASAYATNSQEKCSIIHFETSDEFFKWSKENNYVNYAVEITETSKKISDFTFNKNCNLIFGNEFSGLPQEILIKCDETLVIPQFGPIACLNVAVAASIAFYELNRNNDNTNEVFNDKYLEF